jgi:hypothetical protein
MMSEFPDTSSVQRDLGRLEARQNSADDRLERIEAKLDEVLERTNFARGGIRVLIAIGTLGASLGAAVAETVRWFHGPHP